MARRLLNTNKSVARHKRRLVAYRSVVLESLMYKITRVSQKTLSYLRKSANIRIRRRRMYSFDRWIIIDVTVKKETIGAKIAPVHHPFLTESIGFWRRVGNEIFILLV